MKIKLTPDDYKLLKEVDFSEIQDEVFFNDETMEFQTTSDIADIIFNNYILSSSIDGDGNCSEYGRKLYELYDLIFLSEEA